MDKIKKQTVYTEVPVSERLPNDDGWYCCTYGADLKSFFWFTGQIFMNRDGLEFHIITWLEKKEDMIIIDKNKLAEIVDYCFQNIDVILQSRQQEFHRLVAIKHHINNLIKH